MKTQTFYGTHNLSAHTGYSIYGMTSGCFPMQYGEAPKAPALIKCDYCGTRYYETKEAGVKICCPSCGGSNA